MAWRGTRRQRITARHLGVALAVLLTAALASSLWLTHAQPDHAPPYTARVAEVVGQALRIDDDGAEQRSSQLAAASTTKVGDVVRTRPGARLSLRRPGGLAIHVGPATEAVWDSHDALRVVRGVVYIETESNASRDELVVLTHAGRIHHIGTRFGVEVSDRLVRVSVRDGLVRITAAQEATELPAGRLGLLRPGSPLAALPLSVDEGPWNWMQGKAPRFAIEGRSLREVANELAAAAGMALNWPADIVQEADALQLHGPSLQLSPRTALDAVLMTTRFTLREAGQDAEGTARLEVVAP